MLVWLQVRPTARSSPSEASNCRSSGGLFQAFDGIETHQAASRPIPSDFGIQGSYFFRYQRHFVYWRWLDSGDIGIVTTLHERIHQISRFQDDFGL